MKKNPISIFIIVLALELVCFIADLAIPRGYGKWVLYLFPFLLLWNSKPYQILSMAVAITFMQTIGWVFSPPGAIPMTASLLNRMAGVSILWTMSLLFISRYKSELRLLQSQKTFSDLIERAPFGIYVIDSHFRIMQMNAGSQSGAFRNVHHVIGRDFSEAIHILWPEPVASEIITHFRHTLDTGEPYFSPRFINTRQDVGTVESYEWELHRMILADGQFGVVCYYYDSTELHKAEAAQRESEERFRLLVENIQDYAIFMLDTEGRVITWNSGAQRLKGYSAEEIIGRNFSCFYPPESLDAPERELSIADRVGHFSDEGWRIRKDGSRFWASVTITALRQENGELRGFSNITRDMTERRKAEARLNFQADLLENISDVVYATDLQFRVTAWNHSAEKIYGWKVEEALGKSFFEVVGSKFDPEKRTILTQELLQKGSVTSQIEHTDKSGRTVIFDTVTMVLRDAAGNANGFVGVNRDITERKRAEQDLKKSEDRLRILNENLETMVVQRTKQVRDLSKALTIAEQRERQRFSQVLHEGLQQTLFAAKTQVGLINCESPEDIEDSANDIAQAKTLINKAITTARSLAIELNPPILKNEGLDAALRWLSNHMEKQYGLITCIDVSNELSVVKGIDQILIIQLTRELLYNIVKHARTKEVVITGRKVGGNLEITVEDRGIGFDVNLARKTVSNETGLGLFSIEERLRLFGGKLDMESELNKGTRITITMPISEESTRV